MNNFSNSFEIIVDNPSPKCSPNLGKLPQVDISTLKKCSQPREYYYTIPAANLKFIVSEEEGSEGYFNTICKIVMKSRGIEF